MEVARNQKAVGWSSSHVGVSCAVCPKDEIKTDAEDRHETVPANRCTPGPRWDSERLRPRCISCHTSSLPEDQRKPDCGIDLLLLHLFFPIKTKSQNEKREKTCKNVIEKLTPKPGVVVHAWNPSSLEVKTGRLEIHPKVFSEFILSSGYIDHAPFPKLNLNKAIYQEIKPPIILDSEKT